MKRKSPKTSQKKKKAKEKYEITNLVASGDLGLIVDLHEITSSFKNVEYEPEQFPGAIMKINDPQATILVFKNGKIVVVGCRDEKTIKKAIKKVYELLKPLAKGERFKFNPKKLKYDITNMVAAADLVMDLDLFTVAFELNDVEYEPEQFPGAIIKLRQPNVSVLLFKNGKIIIAGAKGEKDIEDAIGKVRNLVKRFDRGRK